MLSLSIVLKMWNNIIKLKSITNLVIKFLRVFTTQYLAILMLFCNIVRPQKLEDHKVVLHPCKLCNFWKMICWTQEYDLFRDRLIFFKVFAWAVWQSPNARLFKKKQASPEWSLSQRPPSLMFSENFGNNTPYLAF